MSVENQSGSADKFCKKRRHQVSIFDVTVNAIPPVKEWDEISIKSTLTLSLSANVQIY